jgi:hypothetical protein
MNRWSREMWKFQRFQQLNFTQGRKKKCYAIRVTKTPKPKYNEKWRYSWLPRFTVCWCCRPWLPLARLPLRLCVFLLLKKRIQSNFTHEKVPLKTLLKKRQVDGAPPITLHASSARLYATYGPHLRKPQKQKQRKMGGQLRHLYFYKTPSPE